MFDESLQAFCANWYLSTRFDNFLRIKNFNPVHFSLARNHSTFTFNEIFRLNQMEISSIQKIELMKKYSDFDEKQPMSFILFIQQFLDSSDYLSNY